MQTVAWLAAAAVADAIRQNDEVVLCVQQLAGAEKNSRERRGEKSAPSSAGSVADDYGVADFAARVAFWRSQRVIVQLQFGQRFAGTEMEIANRVVTLLQCFRPRRALQTSRKCYWSRLAGLRR